MGDLKEGPAVLPGHEENCEATVYTVSEERRTVKIVRTGSCSENPLGDWAASNPTKENPKDFHFWMGEFRNLTHEVVLIGAWLTSDPATDGYILGYKDYRVSVYHDPLRDLIGH
ncbi:hypothetical protein FZZ93_05870 [Halomonas eurihalina]|uniref:Uncharacterized protein n=1 Tax=Halomonas eurihalina TaxID=42566 RepID=A0A5D9DCS2_HALER|nr:hypothetical protein [Halomonas eurihalina]MDR5859389.1 hypothetical protein [Halomonas eurihalina]TZG40571.1 hypothetical protein FZZ93_05870 [Halomonas eurihalina]